MTHAYKGLGNTICQSCGHSLNNPIHTKVRLVDLKTEHYRIYTGPTLVEAVAERLTQFMKVTCIGTENVYVETYFTPTEICDMLGFTWRLRDVVRIGA